ncbi:MAG: hypothetical protein DWQ47_07625 [Acidobacteria bacterium]|nr:MAG: hypothetical protein DWQ32_15725 [Acidobacteriota bacterium]REJ99210.1 MAG: hypothetical protein DWQ38_14250 [Acidobacteriota bacterium]REK16069.1 MAG: hypothetical protein DWQ43_03435 [Acidobacteriota bacterium]REK43750.1 MAG: hypothetical protein DWQ47_07625 [Acidobacteriota bacterium]
MIEDLPILWPLLISASTIFCAVMLLWAAIRANATIKAIGFLTALSFVVLAVQGFLGSSGFYLEVGAVPARLLGAAPPSILLLLFVVFVMMPRGADALRTLTLLHTVRIPVEIVLWGLFIYGQVPQLMTFEGVNPDILSGLTAPLAAWLGFKDGEPRKVFLIVWNLAALLLLFNIVTRAILSVPTPFQQFGFEQPNVGVLYFPFIWLPAFIVPAVFAAHLWSLRELLLPTD